MIKMNTTTEPDIGAILKAQEYLSQHHTNLNKLKIDVLLKNGQKAEFELPKMTIDVLVEVLNQLAKNGSGTNIEIQPIDLNKMVSPAVAAKHLGMSRPKVTSYIMAGQIPSIKVGTHHRIKLADVMIFKERLSNAKESREATLSQVANFEQESDHM